MSEQRYTVLEHIDAGGMAEVFKANSSSVKGFDKLVAIKRILPSLTKNERFVRMFLDEAKVSLFLNHTNCVQVFDLVYAENTYLIIMEYVNGVNLKSLIEKGPQIPIQCAVYIAIEMSKGLAHAHNKCDRDGNPLGIVHRDVSPANIMVSVEGEVKVTDFGLAKARDQVEKTDPGVVKGKFGYLSPESAWGKEVDKRTDIFAVGILLWEMLTGRRLFLGETDLDTLKQVRKNKVRPASTIRPEVPSSLDQILRHALATDPNHRYQCTEDMIKDLTKFMFLYGKPVSALDIAELVNQQKSKVRPSTRTTEDRVLEQELQEAVNKLVSLEKILSESEDLDRYMAEVYGSMESEPGDPSDRTFSGEINFEDPSMWADLGLDEAELGITEGAANGPNHNWQERPLSGRDWQKMTLVEHGDPPSERKQPPRRPPSLTLNGDDEHTKIIEQPFPEEENQPEVPNQPPNKLPVASASASTSNLTSQIPIRPGNISSTKKSNSTGLIILLIIIVLIIIAMIILIATMK